MIRWRVIGGALAGATYVVIAGLDVRAFQRPFFLLLALAGAVLGALPALAVALVRRRWPGVPPSTALEAMLRGALHTAVVIFASATVCYLGIRKLGQITRLTPDATDAGLAVRGAIAWLIVLLALGAGRKALRRIPARAPEARTVAAFTCVALLAAVFSGFAAPRYVVHVEPPPPQPESPAPRLVVVGIDGLGADLLERYREHLPNLSRLADRAAHGTVHTREPRLSGEIWTTIATGRPLEEHGISNFELFLKDPDAGTIPAAKLYQHPLPGLLVLPAMIGWKLGHVSILPATRVHRRGDAFWTDPAFGRVGVACWPATWPAEPVAGGMVSQFWAPSKFDMLAHHRAAMSNLVHPPELEERLEPLRVRGGDPPDPELLVLAALTEEETRGFTPSLAIGETTPPGEDAISTTHFGALHTRACNRAARALFETKPSTLVVYFEALDDAFHVLLPDENGVIPGRTREDSERLRPYLEGYLRLFDREIAWLLELGDERTTTIVLSDHSMGPDLENPIIPNWHTDGGVVLAAGPGFDPSRPLGPGGPQRFRPLFESAVRSP